MSKLARTALRGLTLPGTAKNTKTIINSKIQNHEKFYNNFNEFSLKSHKVKSL